jgi:pseudaminic acid biosynthesis-associated methylase
MSRQKEWWEGEGGDAYHERNQVDWEKRIPFWRGLLRKIQIESVLELGCGPGWNLAAINRVDPEIILGGVEINPTARQSASYRGIAMLDPDNLKHWSADLTFTAGCLIHIPPDKIGATMNDLVTAARKFVLCIEYEAEEQTEIEYRGQSGLLWKRPYCEMYMAMGLQVREIGFLKPEDGFDNCKYGVFEK